MIYLLQVSTCWILFFGIYLLFLRKETFFSINRYYLLSALLVGLVIPIVGGFLPANNASVEVYQVMNQLTIAEVSPSHQIVEESYFYFGTILWMIYSLGAMIVLSRFVYGLSKIYAIYNDSEKSKRHSYTLVESNHFHLPFSFFQFIFISKKLPLNDEVQKVLKHEELHAHQWHSVDIVFAELLQVFFWFNPILIFYKKALRQSHEFLADAYVAEDHNKKSYSQLLLKQSSSGLEVALANHFFHSQIKKRITMMYTEKSKKSALVKYLAAVPVLMAMIIIFSSNQMSSTEGFDILKLDAERLDVMILSNGAYTIKSTPVSIDEIEILCSNDKVKTTSIHLTSIGENHESKVKNLMSVVSKYGIELIEIPRKKIIEGAKDLFGLKDILKEEIAQNQELNFDGRKIIHRNWKAMIQSLDNATGTIVVIAEANEDGKIIYTEIDEEKSTIKDRTVLKNVLKAAKGYKIEPADKISKGILSFDLNTKKSTSPSHDYYIEKLGYGNKEVEKKQKAPEQGDPLFMVVEEMPRFPGCEDMEGSVKEIEECAKGKMLEYIYSNLKYPSLAKDKGTEGMVVIQFVVEKDGSISGSKIVRDIGGGCAQESKRVVDSMPKWRAGRQRNKAVRVQYTLPVKFKLESDTEETESKINMPVVVGFGSPNEKATKENLSTSDALESSDEVFKVVEEMPRFSGCEDMEGSAKEIEECAKGKMLEFIYRNIRYPAEARKKGIEGVAVVQFIVGEDGLLSDTRIVRNPGGGTGEDALRVINEMPRWIPGKQQGRKVKVLYTLPVKFKLESGESDEKSKGSIEGKKVKNNIVLKSSDIDAMDPLFIVDGKELESGSLESLDADEIESVNVIKGEKAIEQYGEKGKNGVVVIVTKKKD